MILTSIKRTIRNIPGFSQYPGQFWLLLCGAFINSVGGTMIWPFLLLFFRSNLGISMLEASSLLTVKAAASLAFSFLAGTLTDRMGRKSVMVFSLISSGLIYLLFIPQNPYWVFVILMALSGTVEPMYRIGSNAMVADMLPIQSRSSGYASMRMIVNIGMTIGPVLSGLLILKSYAFMFSVSAACLIFYGLFLWVLIRETLVKSESQAERKSSGIREPGYREIFKDKVFIAICVLFFFTTTCMAPVFITLTAYASENFAIPESQLALIMTTNAVMVILFQFPFTKFTEKRSPIAMMTVGALLYALGAGSVGLGSTLIHFILSMAVLTVGEIILMPTATTFTANIAPQHLRGRYMSVYGIAMEAGIGLGPIMAGALNDFYFPKAIWIGCLVVGMIGFAGFVVLSFKVKTPTSQAMSDAMTV